MWGFSLRSSGKAGTTPLAGNNISDAVRLRIREQGKEEK